MAHKQLNTLLLEAHNFIEGSGANPAFNPRCSICGHLVFHSPCYPTTSHSIDSCIKIFTRQQPEQSIGPRQMQEAALQRWRQWLPPVDISLREDGLDLQFFFRLFDDYFFQGRTKHNTTVGWTEYLPYGEILGRTIVDGTRAVISITRLHPQEVWTGESVIFLLSTLLHEMAHSFVKLEGCRCPTCLCPMTIPNTRGLSGHGPVWVKLCEAMEAEATRSLQGLYGTWDLDCKEHGLSLRNERRKRDIVNKWLSFISAINTQ